MSSRLRLRNVFRLASDSRAGVGSKRSGPRVGRDSASLHRNSRPEAWKASEASLASEREKKVQRDVSSTSVGGAEGGDSSASPRRRARMLTTE